MHKYFEVERKARDPHEAGKREGSEEVRKKHTAPPLDGTNSPARASAARRGEGVGRDGRRRNWREVAGKDTPI